MISVIFIPKFLIFKLQLVYRRFYVSFSMQLVRIFQSFLLKFISTSFIEFGKFPKVSFLFTVFNFFKSILRELKG